MIPTVCATGKVVGICFIRDIRLKISGAYTGVTQSAMIWSIGRIFRTPSIQTSSIPVFSGAAYVEEDRVIAMYHGTRLGNMVATSSDPLLLNWEKLTTDRASIPITQPNGEPWPYRIFDPCIWKKDDLYYSLSAGRKPDPDGPSDRMMRANFLFRSKDLVNWEYMHPFVENDRFTIVGDDGACPYFWPIGNKHILPFFQPL